jgi:Ca2+-binding RTX toxin-like protein
MKEAEDIMKSRDFRLDLFESRLHLSVSLVNRTLVIVTADRDDSIVVRQTPQLVRTNINGRIRQFALDSVRRLNIQSGGGRDRVQLKLMTRPCTVQAGDGQDRVIGGAGNDLIFGSDGEDLLRGGDGNDTLRGDDDDDTLWGDGGEDHLNGGEDEDDLHGGDGNDRIDSRDGYWDDDVDGGSGDDEAEVDGFLSLGEDDVDDVEEIDY